ncbi:MAG: thioredoxin family protein [Patescibacteria group bacterium]
MIELVEIMVLGCIECKKFKDWWEKNSQNFKNINFQEIDATTPKGQEMVLKYKIFSSPGIIINDELFSSGGVNTDKLTEKLKSLGA